MSLYRGTKTEENLRAAFAGESMARNKYSYFSAVARKEGLTEIAEKYERLANNEMAHAKLWFDALFGTPDATEKNLISSAQGEYDEWHGMYPDFAKQARADGFEQLAVMFDLVANIEREHELQFMSLLASIPRTTVPAREAPQTEIRNGYRCAFCGAVFDSRPDVCGVCQAIGSFEECTYEATKD